jgi:hypothetical protein
VSGISFSDGDVLACADAGSRFGFAAGPSNADLVYALRRAETEVDSHVIMGEVAASAPHLADLRSPCGFNFDTGADGIAVTGSADETEADTGWAGN